jgi:hypothetical protein
MLQVHTYRLRGLLPDGRTSRPDEPAGAALCPELVDLR